MELRFYKSQMTTKHVFRFMMHYLCMSHQKNVTTVCPVIYAEAYE